MLARRTLLGSGLGSCLAAAVAPRRAGAEPPRLRVGVVGLVHGHVGGFFDAALARTDVEIVGVVEPNDDLASRIMERRKLAPELRQPNVEALITKARPEVLVLYTNTFDHLAAVQVAAAHGVHVMMEKPLAVSLAHGRAIAAAARRGKIHVLVNYETTWYPSNGRIWEEVKTKRSLGAIRKMVAHHGHGGPKEIGVSPEFLAWLTDPVKNGAGALYDFGCYGANLMTWLMDGKRPTSVTAVLQTQKPQVYPRVDDEATILLTYPGAQGIIQGSWNWPYRRKDLEVYGAGGLAIALDRDQTRVQVGKGAEERGKAPALPAPHGDALSYLIAVVRGQLRPEGLSSLENNLVVTEILDAARRSAATGRTIKYDARSATTP